MIEPDLKVTICLTETQKAERPQSKSVATDSIKSLLDF